jgi:hypothetical protein
MAASLPWPANRHLHSQNNDNELMASLQRFERFGSRVSAPMTNQDLEFNGIQDYEGSVTAFLETT